MAIPDEVIAFMANLIQSNIRALEGALIKLMAYASLARSPVTKQLASDVLSSYYVERMPMRDGGRREFTVGPPRSACRRTIQFPSTRSPDERGRADCGPHH